MINPNFVILGAFINLLGAASYISDTLKGKVKPNKVSWGLWSIAPLIAFAAEVVQGVGIRSLMTFMVGFAPFLIFISSFFNKKAYWKISRFDIICGILSMGGLILWYITKVGNIAILFSIFADLMAGIPTLTKAFKYPETENYLEFTSSFVSAIILMLTLKSWTFAYYGFPLYIFLYDFLAVVLIRFQIGKRILKSSIRKYDKRG